MDATITGKIAEGEVRILSSKSELHRMILISAFADKPTKILYSGKPSKDVVATIGTIQSIGAKVDSKDGYFIVYPITEIDENQAQVFCNESGSTLRFILPIFSSIGKRFTVTVSGRLGERPLSPMYETLKDNGVILSENGKYPLDVSGRFTGGKVSIRGDVSSQFISGLLMAMPLTKNGGSVEVIGDFQSRPYVDITIGVMEKFGVTVSEENNVFTVSGKYKSSGEITAGGDWSNTAFFACMGALGNGVTVSGLEENSNQGDRAIKEILASFGAKVNFIDKSLRVEKSQLNGIEIDAKDIPDLVPVLACVGALAKGVTKIYNAERLRIKESDRIKSVCDMINAVGGEAKELADGIVVYGKEELTGGVVDSQNDHRIVMSASVLALRCKNPIKILGANAVEKSYPQFFDIIKTLGYKVEV